MKNFFAFLKNLSLFIFFFLFFTSIAVANFEKNTSNPILDIGNPGSWDDELVSAPSIVKDNKEYKLWFTGFDGTKGQIGLATSSDGINWLKYQNNPVISPKIGDPWEVEIGEPSVYFDGNIYTMWLTSFNFTQKESFRISRTTSTDGINWAPHNIVFVKSFASWESEGVGGPYVIFINNEFKMWYGAKDSNGIWSIGHATSSDGINWIRNLNPVMQASLPWEGTTVGASSVYYDGQTYHMYYHAGPIIPQFIGHATSSDGINWTKDPNPILVRGGFLDFDDNMIAAPRVLRTNNTLKLYYAGHDGNHWRIGLAEELLPVPYFSQSDLLWGSDIYDSKTLTMSSLGCAVTSAAMILKHYNVQKTPGNAATGLPIKDLNPGTLNEWLKSQNDAYFRNGSTNWALISKLTKLSHDLDPTSPKLEYFSSPSASLATTLEASIPAILNLDYPPSPADTHFVVATKVQDATYAINDPYYADRTTLSPHYSTINRIGFYKPTNSDFSYLIFAVDPEVNITLKDNSGNPVGDQYVDKPIFDQINQTPSGSIPLKVLYYKQPPSTNYTVELSSDTLKSYQLDTYTYNESGVGGIQTNTGAVGLNDTDTITLTVDSSATGGSEIKPLVTFDSFITDINTANSLGWIKSPTTYTDLLNKTTSAQNLAGQLRYREAKQTLTQLLQSIKSPNPRTVTDAAFTLFNNDVRSLIDSFPH